MKWVFISLGGMTLIIGVLTLWTPIPTGLPLLAVGTAMLYPHSRFVRVRVRYLARKHPLASQLLARVRARLRKGEPAPSATVMARPAPRNGEARSRG